MISLQDYFGKWYDHPDANKDRRANAVRLLTACASLHKLAEADGVVFWINPATGSLVSGQTFGGFRPQSCSQGASKSSHKEGLAVDLYDPRGEIDAWCMAHMEQMIQCGIYIEHPSATDKWSHWTIKAPHSGNRVFYP